MLTEIQEHGAVLNALGAGGAVQPTVVVSLGTGCKPAEQVQLHPQELKVGDCNHVIF